MTYPIELPAPYHSPTGIATDPGGGVWLFAQGGTAATPLDTVFYWSNATSQLSQFQLDGSNPALQAGADTPIVVDEAGTAWVGDNRTLVSVDRATGTVTSITLPDVAFEGSNGNGLPTPPSATYAEDYSDIDALALAPDGSIVVARQYATELQLVDPSSGAVTSLPLPPGTELASLGSGDVAGLGADEIAATLYAGEGVHELGQYAAGSWTVSQSPCPAYAVSMTSTMIAVTGPGCVSTAYLPASGASTLQPQPVSSEVGSEQYPGAVPLGSSHVAINEGGTIEIAPLGAAVTATVSLGQIAVALSSSPGGSSQAGVTSSPISAGLTAPTAGGSLWFVPAQGGTSVGLLEAG